jgi:hypothetical protein
MSEDIKHNCKTCAYEDRDEDDYRECGGHEVSMLDYSERCDQMKLADQEKCEYWKGAYHLIKHVGLHAYRLKEPLRYSLRERAFVETWIEENTRVPWVNYGTALLEAMLVPREIIDKQKDHFFDGTPVHELTQREAEIAATVIQWLGTNNGQSFLWKVEQKIKEKSEKGGEGWN